MTFHTHLDAPTWASATFSLGLILPALAAAVAYALLFFRIPDRTARYRIAMVSGGFVLWFAFSTVSTITRLLADVQEQSFLARLVGQLLGVLAAVLTLMAYDPPKWLQRRFGLRSVQEQTQAKGEVFGRRQTTPL